MVAYYGDSSEADFFGKSFIECEKMRQCCVSPDVEICGEKYKKTASCITLRHRE